jgi:hypothetical protein
MGVLGGLGGIGWLLPAGAALMAGPHGDPLPIAPPLYRAPTTLRVSDYSAETSVLSTTDRFRIARARSAMVAGDLGAWSLSVDVSRARSAHQEAERILHRDGFATYQAGAATRTALPGNLMLGAGGSLTYMTRRLGPLDFDGRPRHSFILDADLSIARGSADRLTLSYVDVAPASSRTPIARMAELIGGSPRAARGLHLAYSHHDSGDRSTALSWGIDASAMRISAQDSFLLGAAAKALDRRVALSIDRRF